MHPVLYCIVLMYVTMYVHDMMHQWGVVTTRPQRCLLAPMTTNVTPGHWYVRNIPCSTVPLTISLNIYQSAPMLPFHVSTHFFSHFSFPLLSSLLLSSRILTSPHLTSPLFTSSHLFPSPYRGYYATCSYPVLRHSTVPL